MWSFEEDWEFTASVDFASFPKNYYYLQDTYPMNCPETQTYYRCWNHNESSNVYLASTEHLDENSIKNQFLFSIPADDARISCVYSLLLKQFTLSKEAYTYYSHIKKLTEENNGIFQPMPYEVYGNVNCISRPEKKVLGYILASNISTKRIFVNAADFKNVFQSILESVQKLNFQQQRTSTKTTKCYIRAKRRSCTFLSFRT